LSEVIEDTWKGFELFITTYFWLYVIALLGGGSLSGLIAFFAYKACAPTRCKLAEEIFHLLGVKNIRTVNLNKVTKKREQQLKDNGK
ncbi:hypothetical protein, partial [Enterobacter hormaechei]